jgi:hypothetical protein
MSEIHVIGLKRVAIRALDAAGSRESEMQYGDIILSDTRYFAQKRIDTKGLVESLPGTEPESVRVEYRRAP